MYHPSGSEGEPQEVAGRRPHRVFLGGVAVQEATAWPSQERGQGGGLEDSPGGWGAGRGLQGCELEEKWHASVLSERTQAVGQLQIKARKGSVTELWTQRGPCQTL